GRIFWTTQVQPVHYSIDSMLPDGSSVQHLTVPQSPGISTQPAVSPDGTVVASVNVNNSNHIELMNADGSGVVDLGVSGLYPTWSPDQSRVAFVAPDGIHSTDGKHDVLLIPIPTGNLTGPIAWSPDGTKIAFSFRHRRRLGGRPRADRAADQLAHPRRSGSLLVADRRQDRLQEQSPLRQRRRRRPVRDERRRQQPDAAIPRQA